MDEPSDPVARQYNDYPYPLPYQDLDEQLAKDVRILGDPARYAPFIWPEGRPRRDLDILSAGCGTHQAAYLAHTNPDCRVTGIDLSATSLEHERFLQAKHGLTNLELYELDILQAANLGQTFDLIFCTGVLHHTPDPDASLRALAAVLRPHGAMCLMIYARAKRLGIYLLQDAFRRLGVEQNAEGIAFVRQAIAELPPNHFVGNMLMSGGDFTHDAGVVDMFLHPRDSALCVPELLDYVERNGLVFQTWFHNEVYHTDRLFRPDSTVAQAIQRLPIREQWAVVENLMIAGDGRHAFIACRPERDARRYGIDFSGTDWLDYFPLRHPRVQIVTPAVPPDKSGAYAQRGWTFNLAPRPAVLFEQADGSRRLREIVADPLFAAGEEPTELARRVCARLWRSGLACFSRVPVGG
jgi:SAM-dependent methyltransferase